MNKSDSITALAPALVAFQSELKPVAKDASNPHFNSRYLSLGALSEYVTPFLAKHGLSVMQIGTPSDHPGTIRLETILMHQSGEWVSGAMTLPIGERKTPQAVGSAVTYARRYGLASILGVVADEDDDGNLASQQSQPQAQYQQNQGYAQQQQQQRAPQQQQNFSNLPPPGIAASPAEAPTGPQWDAINKIQAKLGVNADAICQEKFGFPIAQANKGAASEMIKHLQGMANQQAPTQQPATQPAPVTANAPENLTGAPAVAPVQAAPAPVDDIPF